MVPGLTVLSSTDVASGARILFQLMLIRDKNRKRGISETLQKILLNTCFSCYSRARQKQGRQEGYGNVLDNIYCLVSKRIKHHLNKHATCFSSNAKCVHQRGTKQGCSVNIRICSVWWSGSEGVKVFLVRNQNLLQNPLPKHSSKQNQRKEI